jgi:hypothetical protein
MNVSDYRSFAQPMPTLTDGERCQVQRLSMRMSKSFVPKVALLMTCLLGCGDDGPHANEARFIYAVTAVVIGSFGLIQTLDFDVDYLGEQGRWAILHHDADCDVLVTDASFTAGVNDERLSVSVLSIDGFDTPTDLIRCTFLARDSTAVADFDVTVRGARNLDGETPPEIPEVYVSSVRPLVEP